MDLTDLYNSLGIYELRCLAREKGITRPTLKRKSELVRELNEISNDETLTLTLLVLKADDLIRRLTFLLQLKTIIAIIFLFFKK